MMAESLINFDKDKFSNTAEVRNKMELPFLGGHTEKNKYYDAVKTHIGPETRFVANLAFFGLHSRCLVS